MEAAPAFERQSVGAAASYEVWGREMMRASGQISVRNGVRAFKSVIFLSVISILAAGQAQAYIGDSFISIPGEHGHWKGEDHKGWVRAEASEWQGVIQPPMSGPGDFLAGDKLWFGGPGGAKPGGDGKIVLSLSKTNPDLPALMSLCASKAVLPELGYAESSDRSRPVLENGPRPANLPAYWEYKFKGAKIVDCPVLDGAPQQALVITFDDIEWLNYDPKAPMGNRIVIPPEKIFAVLPAEPKPGKKIKSYLITWIAPATDPGDEACPKLNSKPQDADVYRYLSPEDAAKMHAKYANKAFTYGSETEHRGPDRLSVSAFPGIVPDNPVQFEPQTTVAEGLDLDGNDGTGTPPKGIRKHENFVSPDGRKGIDNQLLRVWGCVTGFRGKRGYSNQTPNARRADGNTVTLIEVSNISNEQNDRDVYIALIHSQDKPVRDNTGKKFIAGYSFRPTYNPNFAYYNVRVHAHIKDGVITSDVIPDWKYNPGQGPAGDLYKTQIRLEPQPDGSVKGIIGGYMDFRNRGFGGYGEGLFNFQSQAAYYSMLRNADGLYDPASGEYHGLSMAYEVDTVPAFITPLSPEALAAARSEAAHSEIASKSGR